MIKQLSPSQNIKQKSMYMIRHWQLGLQKTSVRYEARDLLEVFHQDLNSGIKCSVLVTFILMSFRVTLKKQEISRL